MKTITKKTYLLYFLPFTLFSQSPFGPSSSSQKEEMPGMEQLDATRYISYDYQSTKINPLRDHHNGQKANYSRMLHDEANRNLFFRHENNKKLRAANKRFGTGSISLLLPGNKVRPVCLGSVLVLLA